MAAESSPRLFGAADVRLGRQRSPQHDIGPHMVPYLRAANVKDGELDLSDVKSMNFDPSEQKTFALQPGDILVTEGSGSLGAVGASAVWSGELPGTICFQNTLVRLRPRSGVSDGRFLGWWARAAYASGQFAAIASGANIYHVSAERVKSLPAPLPPLDEQRRIADFLDAETAHIVSLEQKRREQLERLDERYGSLISEVITPGISKGEEVSLRWPWLPASIPTVRLGYIARVKSGVTVHEGRDKTPDDSEYPYLRVANVQGEEVDLSEVKSITIPKSMAARAKLRVGDVLMTEANGNPDNLGRGAVWRGEIADAVHQNHVFAIRVNERRLRPEYLSALLASTHGRRYFRFTSAQVGIATTSSSKVLDLPVPILPLGEQYVAAARCQEARTETGGAAGFLARQLALLTERREALITAAVTGQIDVTTARGVSE
ncbi:MAG: restriction endonuclease subunit S [Pseudonocardia sp.]